MKTFFVAHFVRPCFAPAIPRFKMGNHIVRASHSAAGSGKLCQSLEKLITSHKIVVISKSYCPYCRKAKNALKSYNIDDMHVWEIDGEPNSAQIQECLMQMTGARTVPRVFINGKFVGGGEDTVRMHKSGKLAKLLKP